MHGEIDNVQLLLTIPYSDFKLKGDSLLAEANVLYDKQIKDQSELNVFKKDYDSWHSSVLIFLNTSFNIVHNKFEAEFMETHASDYLVPGADPVTFAIKSYKFLLTAKQGTLSYIIIMVGLSDAIINPSIIESEKRSEFSIEEKLKLLVGKLSQVYRDQYPVKELLINNGVRLRSLTEPEELARMLEDRKYVETEYTDTGIMLAGLTLEGLNFFEQSIKTQKQNKNMEDEQEIVIFISHGGSNLWKDVARYIEKTIGYDTVILQERPNRGRTVIEKLEDETDNCDFAIIVMTAEDMQEDGAQRARQNVVHEIGFCQGLFGRDRVLVLKQKGVEGFTNISGIVYEEFIDDNIKSTFPRIMQEIEDLEEELDEEEG